MKIKVCGMKHAENIKDLLTLEIDYMGLIFYQKSPRCVDLNIEFDVPNKIKKVGVFVNADKEYIFNKIDEYQLDMIQLHGNESPELCKELGKRCSTIKAFNILNENDLEQVKDYDGACNYFLFDTKTSQHGGSGEKFDWSILDSYVGTTPFLLSGGICESDAKEIKQIKHPAFWGIDLNSRFEIEAGMKDIKKLDKFINEIRS